MVLIRNSQQLFFIECYKKLIKEEKNMQNYAIFYFIYVELRMKAAIVW